MIVKNGERNYELFASEMSDDCVNRDGLLNCRTCIANNGITCTAKRLGKYPDDWSPDEMEFIDGESYADPVRGFEALKKGVKLPTRATSKSAGYDIRSSEYVYIRKGEIRIVETGLTAYMMHNEQLELRCRSGLASRGLMLANGVGTIDSDYYGKPIKFIFFNVGEDIEISKGDRIGQGIFTKYYLADHDEILSGERKGGFGSTGLS